MSVKRKHTSCRILLHLFRMFCSGMVFMHMACEQRTDHYAQQYNDLAYAYHYRNLDSTRHYAQLALSVPDATDGQRAEAMNNLAFAQIAQMNYKSARQLLDSIPLITENQLELFIADIQQMRICQRCSENKLFYDWRERAEQCLQRIQEDVSQLTPYQQKRMIYAESEYYIVLSTYYYYMGLERQSMEALSHLHNKENLTRDTAQYVAYLYNHGAGGSIKNGSPESIAQQEFTLLTRCYQIALRHGYPYWQANALQAISEHLLSPTLRDTLIAANKIALQYINSMNVPDSMLAGQLATQALDIFAAYGDVYQMAGAYRTLAACYQQIGDYDHAFTLLHDALDADTLVMQAPDLAASIYEQLSIVSAALNDKTQSDRYRNHYLDLVGHTEQDKAQEALADQLTEADKQRNITITLIGLMLCAGLATMYVFYRKHRRQQLSFSRQTVYQPVEEWRMHLQKENWKYIDEDTQLDEQLESSELLLHANQFKYIEQRTKVAIVNSITPLIDRILVEYQRSNGTLSEEQKEYVQALTLKIEDYNVSLTQWIKMQQGSLNLHIESFPLQTLFDIVAHNKTSFSLKGITLDIKPTQAVVKADPTLTLFMMNTIADNARRYTEEGGHICIEACEGQRYVEINITDDGVGMTPEQCATLFKLHPSFTSQPDKEIAPQHHRSVSSQTHYGFGLLNCSGIIEKYRKLSPVFSVCEIGCDSQPGKGSRFHFRLPKGILRTISVLLFALLPVCGFARQHTSNPFTPAQWADSAWYANVNGNYQQAIEAAQQAIYLINKEYLKQHKQIKDTLLTQGPLATTAPEIKWFHNNITAPYDIILDLRNETAVASLALHDWQRYQYNNRVYTQLYKERIADNLLVDDIKALQKNIKRKNSIIIILSLLLLGTMLFTWFQYLLPRKRNKKYQQVLANITSILNSKIDKQEQLRIIQKTDVATLPTNFRQIHDNLVKELTDTIAHHQKLQDDIDFKRDQLKRIEYENQRLHVTNSVLDNCLSTLKHETMYFPSRIRQMITDDLQQPDNNIQEITQYYKTLHNLLAAQAQQQIQATPLPANHVLLNMLNEIIQKISTHPTAASSPQITIRQQANDPRYVELTAEYLQPYCLPIPISQLFDFDQHDNQQFLVCRQIVRDIGESSNMRACGIRAKQNDHTQYSIIATLPQKLTEKIIQTTSSSHDPTKINIP